MSGTSPKVIVRAREGVSAEQARASRAAAWNYIFGCFEQKNGAALTTAPNDDVEDLSEHTANTNIQQART